MDSGAHAPVGLKYQYEKIFKNVKITQVSAEGLKINSRLIEVNMLAGMASLVMELHLCKMHCRATTRSINSLLKE